MQLLIIKCNILFNSTGFGEFHVSGAVPCFPHGHSDRVAKGRLRDSYGFDGVLRWGNPDMQIYPKCAMTTKNRPAKILQGDLLIYCISSIYVGVGFKNNYTIARC